MSTALDSALQFDALCWRRITVLRKDEYVENRGEDKGTAQKSRSLAREIGRAIARLSSDDIVVGKRQVIHKTRERNALKR